MGKKSVRENKNIYQLSREEAGLTREKAGDLMDFISPDRIEKIESEKSYPHPDEILVMADVYKNPSLPNYYCSHECPIGMKTVPEIPMKELSQIVLEVLASINFLEKSKNRLIEISVDGTINADEAEDFQAIRKELSRISVSANALQLWIEKKIADGQLDTIEK